MMQRLQISIRRCVALLLGLSGFLALTTPAAAHVKWFVPYNVGEQPVQLRGVLDSNFFVLIALSLALIALGAFIETTFVGKAILRALDSITGVLNVGSEYIMRAIFGVFLLALWQHGGIILTPELKTQTAVISWLQLLMAVSLIWRPTMMITAGGIFVLYGFALTHYSVFHMMDYPIFLGIAIYFGAMSLNLKVFSVEPATVLRWATGLTLIWASVEKWAYPEWTYTLALSHPGMFAGFSKEFFLCASGAVEFSLAFCLLATPLLRRISAIILLGMFVGAILPFGEIDAIGHSAIIAVLLVVIGDNTPSNESQQEIWRSAVGFSGALVLVIGSYYALHALIYSTLIF